jgi:hypothetical protein
LGSGPPTIEEAFFNLRLVRSRGLMILSHRVKAKKRRREIDEILDPIVRQDPDLFDYRGNLREINAWYSFIEALSEPGDDGPSHHEAARAIVESREEPGSDDIRKETEELFGRWWADRRY